MFVSEQLFLVINIFGACLFCLNSKWPPRIKIIQILLSHSSPYGDVQVICSMLLLKFKMAATDQFQFFCGRKNSKVRNYSHSPPYGDVQVIF